MVRQFVVAIAALALLTGCEDRPFIDMCPTSAVSIKAGDLLNVPSTATLVAFLPSCKSCSAEDTAWQHFVKRSDLANTVLVTPDSKAGLEAFLGHKIARAKIFPPEQVLKGHPQAEYLEHSPGNYSQVVTSVQKGVVTATRGFNETN